MTSRSPHAFGLSLAPWTAAVAYAALHAVAVSLGLRLQIDAPSFAIFWPAAGTLLAALLLYPRRYWPWLLGGAAIAEVAANAVFAPQISLAAAATLTIVSCLEAFAGAFLIRRFIGQWLNFGQLTTLLRFGAVIALTTLLGAVTGAMLSQAFGVGDDLLANLRAWWIGDLLGDAAITPLLLSFGYFGIKPYAHCDATLDRHSAAAALLLACAMALVFLRAPSGGASLLDSPYLLCPPLIWIAMTSGARRTALAVLVVISVAAAATLSGKGPFASGLTNVAAATQLQGFLAFVIVPTLILQAVMFERRRATLEAERSDQRYRAFVANSSESIFRTELAEPMPITLPVDEQIDWLRKHMFVAECNPAFLAAQGITAPAGGAGGTNPGTHPPWSNWYLERVREAIANNYQVKDIEHILPGPYGLDRVMLISMFGVVEKGMLTRIWGTGRDVTAMRQAQASLAAHDQKLRELATEITLAEERARRKLAADLHEGPAQNLVALSLELSAMKRVVSDEHTAAKLGELERLTSDTNQQVRTLMAELMPPGLYDGGIVAGVRWLADGMSRQRRLLVSVEDDGVPKPLDEHAAVLLFQTVRELLHNVAKHSRARQAAVRMTADGNQLHIDVIDPGVGFDPDQLGALPQTHRGFGLFSIRERLALMGGTLRISSTIGSGTRVRVTAPLPPQGRLFNQARSA